MIKRYTHRIKSEKQIRIYFENVEKKVFTPEEITEIIEFNRHNWGLAETTPAKKILDRFIANELLQLVEIPINIDHVKPKSSRQTLTSSETLDMLVFEDRKIFVRYVYGEFSIYDIAVSLYNRSYLSHYSAMFLHGLTNQIPKTVYTTHEQSTKPYKKAVLTQSGIDYAFSQPQRRAETRGMWEDYIILLLNGKNSNRTGVMTATKGTYSYTTLERTLIDIAVRPNYAGGAFSVLEAYRNALEQDLSIIKLVRTLNSLDYIYPYHQAIGFYLEKAGYRGKAIASLKDKPMEFDFYLDYQIEAKQYSSEWKIYYPKGM